MRLQTTGATATAPSQQAMTIDLAKLLVFESLSHLKVDVVERDYVRKQGHQ